MATALTGKFVPWQGRVLTEAGLRNPEGWKKIPNILVSYQPETRKY